MLREENLHAIQNDRHEDGQMGLKAVLPRHAETKSIDVEGFASFVVGDPQARNHPLFRYRHQLPSTSLSWLLRQGGADQFLAVADKELTVGKCRRRPRDLPPRERQSWFQHGASRHKRGPSLPSAYTLPFWTIGVAIGPNSCFGSRAQSSYPASYP